MTLWFPSLYWHRQDEHGRKTGIFNEFINIGSNPEQATTHKWQEGL